MKLRCAVVGYGGIGRVHVRVAREYGELCAVCDIDESRLAALEDVNKYTDYEQMLDSERPDVVHICTPHYLHADMVIAALERGINVLCEKPLCIKREDIDRILDAERRSSAMLGVCMQNRYNAANLFVKEYLKDKSIKNAHGLVIWHRDAAYYASGAWRGKWSTEGGGVLINQALHTLDILIWLCGEPDTLVASVANLTLGGVIEVEDTATLICDGKSRFTFNATTGSATDCPVELTLFTEDECIKVMPKQVITGDELHKFTDIYPAHGKACYGNGHEALISDFYSCVTEKRHFAIDGAEGSKVVKAILAAYASGGKKTEIK
ncbi:MAG: Gfo/Idh/MocA family oxidoreductase [Clostridia bacterium]|nr:Gfo/Idh/MocA family oxidoreductase [Clostridia bacterium]